MQSSTRDERLSEGVDPGSTRTGTIESSILASPVSWFEKYLLVLVIGGLVAGIWVASFSQTLVDYVDSTVNLFMDGYGYVAPIAIFLILTPSLARLFATPEYGVVRTVCNRMVRGSQDTGRPLGRSFCVSGLSHTLLGPGLPFPLRRHHADPRVPGQHDAYQQLLLGHVRGRSSE